MKNIALTGGGTGGHVFPLLSVYNFLLKNTDLNFIWFGNKDGLEAKIAKENNIKFQHIPSGKIRRYFDIKNLYEPFKNLNGILFGIYYILVYKIDIIFSKGGFVGFPLSIAGFILGKKIYIHESDSASGLVNKIISKIATKIFYTFPNNLIDSNRHILTGQILNLKLIENIDKIGKIEKNKILEVLVIAGSQGSTTIFKNLKNILNRLCDINFTIILGEKNLHFRQEFAKFSNVILYDFIEQKELGEIYKKTDIAISRAGATALWELYFFGIHTIIVPILNSAQNHQEKNAFYFKKHFGSDVLYENKNLDLEIFKLLHKYKKFRKKSLNLDDFSSALYKIKDEIFKIGGDKNKNFDKNDLSI